MNDQIPPKKPKKVSLGIAGGLAKYFIVSPISLLLIIAFLAVGVLGLQITPRQEDPQVSVPMVDIFVRYPGASAAEVESQITSPLEAIMKEITGVDHVFSASNRGQAIVTVQFIVGEDYNSSIVKLHDKLEANKNLMPRGAKGFLVKPKGADDVPVVTLTLWSNDVEDTSLRLVALDLLQRLREVPDTSQSFIVDGRVEQLVVEILPEKLASYGVSLGQVANTIRMANSERSAGQVEPSNKVVTVITGSFLQTVDDVNRLIVAVVNGQPVYVRDIADVQVKASETNRIINYYTGPAYPIEEGSDKPFAKGASAVTIAIAKKQGSNGVAVSEAILAKVETLKGLTIPDNIYVEVTRDYGASAKAKVNHLIFKLFIATSIVTALVWFFLGWRAAVVVAVIIPIVLTSTVFTAWLLGLTIDRVSLFALIFSIGILVDDAIVVVENIYRRWLLADSLDTTIAVDAVREVGNPTIVATFTVIAALLPMGFVSGMMGPYMSPIPILGTVAMLISLFAAFAMTPWLTYKLKPRIEKLREEAEKEHKQAAAMDRFFRGIIIPLIRNPKKGRLFLYGIIGLFFLSCLFFYTKAVQVKMMPLDNKDEFNIVVNFPEGTSIPVTANLISKMSHRLVSGENKIAEISALQTYAGTASPYNFNGLVRHYYLRDRSWQGDIQVQLSSKNDRSRTSNDVASEVRKILTPMAKAAGARIQVVEMPPGPPVLQTLVAEIYGPDAETRREVARAITKFFEDAKYIADVDNFLEAPHKNLRFIVDTDKAQRNGLSVEDINRTIEMAMGGFVLGDIKKNALIEPTAILMQVPLDVRSDINRLVQLPVTNRAGVSVPLAELGYFEEEAQDAPIYHKDLKPVEFVTGEGVGVFGAPVYGQFEVQDMLAAANDGKGYEAPDETILTTGKWFGTPDDITKSTFEWGGEWTVTYITFRDMGIAFMAALVLIYMLIVAQFGNFVLPAIIMAPIPLTLIGIIPGHWLFGAYFSATSMIGFIALAGIIVRNSILLVDFTREAVVEKGMPIIDAVIHSCEARTRPIAITALALMGGSSVIVGDPIFQGMGVALIFGGLVSTLLTLLIIPLGCISAGNSLGRPVEGDSGSARNLDIDEELRTLRGSKSKSSAYDETIGEKITDISSTIFGIIGMVAGLLFSGVKSLFGLLTGSLSKNNSPETASVSDQAPLAKESVTPVTKTDKPDSKEEKVVEDEPKPSEEPKAEKVVEDEPKPSEEPKVEKVVEDEPKPSEEPKAEKVVEDEPKPSEEPKVEKVVEDEPKPSEEPKAAEVVKKPAAKKAAPAKKAAAKKPATKKPAAKKAAPTKKAPAKKPAAKKAPAKKPAAKKIAPAKKAPAKKPVAKKAAPAKKVAAKKPVAKKATPAKKVPAKKSVDKKEETKPNTDPKDIISDESVVEQKKKEAKPKPATKGGRRGIRLKDDI